MCKVSIITNQLNKLRSNKNADEEQIICLTNINGLVIIMVNRYLTQVLAICQGPLWS